MNLKPKFYPNFMDIRFLFITYSHKIQKGNGKEMKDEKTRLGLTFRCFFIFT